MNALHQDRFCWKKLHDGAILVDPEHAELAERRLIAAPVLLEACRMAQRVLLQMDDHEDYTTRTLNDLAAAIEAAEGRKP